MEPTFKNGDVILYEYTHKLNSRSSTQIIKEGIFLYTAKNHRFNLKAAKCVIKLNGNKSNSRVSLDNIRHKPKDK